MTFIVFSGLPGSGKSTVAREVAPRLSLQLLDKDDFLDELFAERGIGDAKWRSSLSREADARFADAAQRVDGACLVSWWRHAAYDETTGTPTDWFIHLRPPLVEVHCRCRADIAVSRFLARRRHPGHLDASRARSTLEAQFAELAAAGPLGCGTVIDLDTNADVSIEPLVQSLRDVTRSLLPPPG